MPLYRIGMSVRVRVRGWVSEWVDGGEWVGVKGVYARKYEIIIVTLMLILAQFQS